MPIVVIIDYGMGNLRSVEKIIFRLGVEPLITNNLDEIKKATKLILPGVGHFSNGIKNLKSSGIYNILNKKVLIERIPILGICLGMQLMAKYSQEGNKEGLGWIDAEVVRFSVSDNLKYKVPHMGWNNLVKNKNSPLFNGLKQNAMFYFVHSYHMKCNNKTDILSTSEYDYPFVSSIQKDNLYGTQFHPEKSHDSGLIILKNFIDL